MGVPDPNLLAVARGDTPADLLLRGGSIVNVFTREVERGNVAICGGRIAGVGDVNGDGHIDFLISQFGFAAFCLGVPQPSAASWAGATTQRLDLTSPGIEGHQANYGNSVASGN